MTLADHTHARWGVDDRIGAANLMTPERRLAALALVRAGTVYSMGREISAASPFMNTHRAWTSVSGPSKIWNSASFPWK